jgi:hypothetical protein
LLDITRPGAAMKPTKIGNRIIVIGSTIPANEKACHRPPTSRRATPQRIVVIKNGQLVGGRPGR